MTIRYERFEHPSTDGGANWTALAFIGNDQRGGYGPPCEWTGGRWRAVAEPIRPWKPGQVKTLDCDSEDQCRSFIERMIERASATGPITAGP